MSIPVMSDKSIVRNMYSSESRMSEQSHVSEADNRWLIGRTKANKLVNFGYYASTIKVHFIDMQFELSIDTRPAGLIDLFSSFISRKCDLNGKKPANYILLKLHSSWLFVLAVCFHSAEWLLFHYSVPLWKLIIKNLLYCPFSDMLDKLSMNYVALVDADCKLCPTWVGQEILILQAEVLLTKHGKLLD